MGEPEFVDLSRVRPGPIRHDTLSPELLEKIKAVFDVIGQYLRTTLEQFEVGFMRDIHPEGELAAWCGITLAWVAYHQKFLDNQRQSADDESSLLGALIAISTGVRDVSQLHVPAAVGTRLLQCYDDLGTGDR